MKQSHFMILLPIPLTALFMIPYQITCYILLDELILKIHPYRDFLYLLVQLDKLMRKLSSLILSRYFLRRQEMTKAYGRKRTYLQFD